MLRWKKNLSEIKIVWVFEKHFDFVTLCAKCPEFIPFWQSEKISNSYNVNKLLIIWYIMWSGDSEYIYIFSRKFKFCNINAKMISAKYIIVKSSFCLFVEFLLYQFAKIISNFSSLNLLLLNKHKGLKILKFANIGFTNYFFNLQFGRNITHMGFWASQMNPTK